VGEGKVGVALSKAPFHIGVCMHWPPWTTRRQGALLARRILQLELGMDKHKLEAEALVAELHRQLQRARMAEARITARQASRENGHTSSDALDRALMERKGMG